MTIILFLFGHTIFWVMKMRIQIIEPQNKIECGICKAEGDWIKKVNVRGIEALYCLKCDTLTMFDKMPSKYVHRALKRETDKLRQEYLAKQNEQVK